jgi:hypothetical protein
VLGSSSSYQLATQWIASYVLLYRTWHLQREKTLNEDAGGRKNYQQHPNKVSALYLRQDSMERMRNRYYNINLAETIN